MNEKGEIIHFLAGFPGSVHDMRVFQYSGLQQICSMEGEQYFPNDTHLLGDSAYVLETHVIVPFKRDGQLSVEQRFYNTILSSARMSVERGIGLFKNRWRLELDKNPMIKTEFILAYLLASGIFHNLGLRQDDEFYFDPEEQEMINDDGDPLLVTEEQKLDGILKREGILIRLSN